MADSPNPSLCQNCGQRPAATTVELLLEGRTQERALCWPCVRALADLQVQTQEGPAAIPASSGGCPGCGKTLEQGLHEGRWGCPVCYEFFEAAVLEQRGRAGLGEAPYGGRRPSAGPTQKRRQIQEALETALKNEDYEGAAKLRDDLRRLAHEGAES